MRSRAMADSDQRARARAKALLGTLLDGRYRVDAVLAMGGMGCVYRGQHVKLRKRVAIKVLHPDVEDHPEHVLRFEREARAGALVAHANVATATDFGDLEDGSSYLVMEYVQGHTLRTLLDADAPLAPERAVRIGRQIAVALREIHKKGIVHRDLKPRNVMVGEHDFVKVVDFGLSKIDGGARLSVPEGEDDDEDLRISHRGTIFGTIQYLAPEVAFGMELVDQRADLYALGVMFFEMLCGKHPFEAANDAELFRKQRHAPVPRLRERADVDVPEALEAVVRNLLEKDFDERYQTADELLVALDQAMPSGDAPVAPPSGSPSSSFSNVGLSVSSEVLDVKIPRPPRVPHSLLPSDAPKVTVAKARPKRREAWLLAVVVGGLGLTALVVRASRPAPSAANSGLATATESAAPAVGSPRSAPPPEASSSAAPPEGSSSAAPPAPPIASNPAEAKRLRTRLAKDLRNKRWDEAAVGALAVLSTDADALLDVDIAPIVRDAMIALEQKRHGRTEEVWSAVARAKGGTDVLYLIFEGQGKSPEAERARRMLADPEVRALCSPALSLALSLRTLPCNEKLALVDEAVEKGDRRSAVALDIIVRGCQRNRRAMDAPLAKLRARLAEARAAR